MELEEFYRGFAGAEERLDEPFLQGVAVAYATGVTQRFLERHREFLGGGLDAALDRFTTMDVDFSTAWEPTFGLFGEILANRSPVDPADAATRLGLWLASCGISARWEQPLLSPVACRFGPYPLPKADYIRIESDGSEAAIVVSLDGRTTVLELRRTEEGWSTDGVARLPQVRLMDRHLTFLVGDLLESPDFEYLREDLLAESEWESLPTDYGRTCELMRQHAPEYLAWVDRVMRYVLPLRGEGATINSGSSKGEPGLSHISCTAGAIQLGEMLVHESTHHYYYLVTRLGPVDDGSDTNEYYSPVKGRNRPIYYILLAYHAFANVLLFTRACRESGWPDGDGYLAKNERDLVSQLDQLKAGLLKTKALTPLGSSLWEPLAARIG
ncbi:MAG: HEXXH motif-containing putative peptide modification protein [Actinomycetota bacterium]|nr:HEXXH motif-containing putative peptide modification protein [Actinomycetota bacterium]